MNKVTLIGRLGADPKTVETKGDNTLVKFSIATSNSYMKDGKKIETTEWHNIVVWNKTADNCAKYLVKGSRVAVEGKLQTRKWENPETEQTHYFTEIVGMNVEFLDPKKVEQSA